jgi:hypothetical protein
MTSSFRYNKKQRKYYRERARADAIAADKLAENGMDPQIVDAVRKLADINTKLSLAKRRKNQPKNPR